MWLQPVFRGLLMTALIVLTASAWAVDPASGPAAPALPDLIATRQPIFMIPFRVERDTDPTWKPIEAQLHVSTDQGRHWRLYAKAPTDKQQFAFRSGGDAEYWFAIRTADSAGRARPETIAAPGLRVLVDTKPPVLRISAQPVEDAQVLVHWQIDEPRLKPDGLKIVYRPSPTEPWAAVAVGPGTIDAAAISQNGEVMFRAKQGSHDLQIRVEVLDLAGNAASAETRVKLDKPAGPPPPGEPNGSVALAIHPAVGNRQAKFRESPGEAAFPGLPSGERPRMINSRDFELAYDVDSVGPSGIGRVEAWGTRDGGQSWQRMAVEKGGQNPLVVRVNNEGIYGFRAVVTNGAGVGGRPPQSGDSPDLWIGVDVTKPTARIVSVEPGANKEAGRLVISWQADDRMLAARPISLFFSADRSGTWTPIAAGLENTGRYVWMIDGRTPPKVFLRLEVRDEAGNIATHDLAQAVVVDQSQPVVRLRDVRAVDPSTGPEWRP